VLLLLLLRHALALNRLDVARKGLGLLPPPQAL
jgi:hypothetical protein